MAAWSRWRVALRAARALALAGGVAACLGGGTATEAATGAGVGRGADESAPCIVSGRVTDPSGAPVPDATVILRGASFVALVETSTDPTGTFALAGLRPADYIVEVRKAGFDPTILRLTLAAGSGPRHLDVALDIGPHVEAVTVTATRGDVGSTTWLPQFATALNAKDVVQRPGWLFPQALREEAGVSVQQTSTSQASPFVRGLTGQQILNLVDGVRFNTSTFRPGANQYTALVDPFTVGRVEIVHGPGSTQYGSDSLGGTINVLTQGVVRSDQASLVSGTALVGAGTADESVMAGGLVSVGRRQWAALVQGNARRAGDLRAGRGTDSHSVVTRLLGLPSTVLGPRLDQTGFGQYGASAKLAWHPDAQDALSLLYVRTAQDGASRYDQLDGGLGNLLHRFEPQEVDFAVARYDRLDAGPFGSVSLSASFNAQTDGREYQNVNNTTMGLLSDVSHESNRTDVLGVQATGALPPLGRHSLTMGGEYYDEKVRSTREDRSWDAATGDYTRVRQSRGRYPNGAGYGTSGLFVQDVASVVPNRVVVNGAVRYSRFSYSQSAADNPVGNGVPTVSDYSNAFDDVTFNAGVVVALNTALNLTANVARGFRAPNVSDLGAVGVTGGGFEVSPEEAIRVGASIVPYGAATATGALPAAPLEPEELMSYEAGLRLQTGRVTASLALYSSDITDSIERRVLILSPGAVGTTIGGQTIIRQDAIGAVYTALSSSPVFARANAGHVRLQGFEANASGRLSPTLTLAGNVSYVRGTNVETGRPPDLENGIPPLQGLARLRWQPARVRWWGEIYTLFAAAQTRLSENDLRQARIGGMRTRQEIEAFFTNGAAARGLVRAGVLVPTGETLAQVLTRVLGPDLDAQVPLYTENPGYATFNLRGGIQLGRQAELTVILENLFDENYRVMGSGVDGPGFNAVARLRVEF
jgi:outer membrane receptor protein involved in Fe transport